MNFFANVFIGLMYIILLVLILHILYGVIQLLVCLYNYIVNCNINYLTNKIFFCNRKRKTKIMPIEIDKKKKYLLVHDPYGKIYLGTVSEA